MWRSRAEQVADTLSAFRRDTIEQAIVWTAEADRALRDTRPDDRTVMEEYVWKLTGGATA
jgi:DNA polymerase-3 subunit delta